MNRKTRTRFGCRVFLKPNEPFSRIIGRARFCEKYGFDSVHIDDHLLYGTGSAAAPDPFTTLAAIVLQTSKVQAGIAVTDLVRRHPAIVDQAIATLASMAPGRVFLGLGAGDPMNQAPFGLPTQNRFERLREGLRVMKMLWVSNIEHSVSHKGRFFKLTKAYLQAGPWKAPRAPVYLAAFGDKMLQLTGEEADGWIPHCHVPHTYKTDLSKIKETALRAGRSPDLFDPAYYTLASATPKGEVADRNVLGPAKYFLALIPEALAKVDPNASHPGRVWEKQTHPKQQRETIRRIASTIPDKTALDTVIHGVPGDCIEQIARFQNSGCKHFMLTFIPEDGLWSTKGLLPSIRFFAEKVMSYFRGA